MNATAIGDSRYDDRLDESTSPGFREKAFGIERAFLDRARRIDAAQLVAGIAHHLRDLHQPSANRRWPGSSFTRSIMPFNQMSGLPMDLAVYGSGSGPQPFKTVQDYERFLKRVREFPRWADGAIAMMRTGMSRGITLPRPAVAKMVPQLRGIVTPTAEASIYWGPIAAMPADFPAAERERLARGLRGRAHAARCCPPTRGSPISSSATIYPRRVPRWDGATCRKARPGIAGASVVSTTMDLPPEQIHQLGLQEVARIRAEMLAREATGGFPGRPRCVLQVPGGRSAFLFHQRAGTARRVPRREAAHRRAAAETVLGLSEGGLRDPPVEPFRAASAAGASYQAPSADGKRPGIFYINTHNLRAQPRFGLETLSLHEAAPGHHFQIAIQQELTGLPRFRRFNNYVSYAEGWALYAESIGKELGVVHRSVPVVRAAVG